MPRLRVLAGPSYDEMSPIEPNNNMAYPISSDLFEGQIVVHIKGFADERGVVSESDYFQREDRKDITWSIQVQGEHRHHIVIAVLAFLRTDCKSSRVVVLQYYYQYCNFRYKHSPPSTWMGIFGFRHISTVLTRKRP